MPNIKKKTAAKKKPIIKKTNRSKTANQNKTSKKITVSMGLQEKALGYRMAGLSYSAMAKKLNSSKSILHRLVVQALQDSAARVEVNADQLREMELERIDQMITACYTSAIKGSTAHLREIRSFMEFRCKLLGIEAPIVQGGENLTDDNSGNDGNIIIHNHYT